jgi:hypothetical protein
LAQQPSPSLGAAQGASFFLGYPLGKALKNEGGVVSLSEDLAGLLGRFRFPEGPVKFHLLRTHGGKVTTNWPGDDPTSLRGELVAGMQVQIEAAKAEVAGYAALKDVNAKFDEAFGELGKNLFCDEAGDRWLWKLNVKEQGVNNGIVYSFTPEKEKKADGVELVSSLGGYKVSNAARPPLIDYINNHIHDVLDDWAFAGGSTFTSADMDLLKANLNLNATPEKAVEGWKSIAKLSREKKWSERPPTDPTGDLKESRNRVNRYRPDRYRADFFIKWELIFSEDNLKIAKDKLFGGSFDPEHLKVLEGNLTRLKEEAASIQSKPLAELGRFYVVVASGGGYFRLVDIR